MKYKILIDTNIFFIPFYENFDIINELKDFLMKNNIEYEGFYTLRKNIIEIKSKINSSKSEKWKKIYSLVLEYIKKNNINIIETKENYEKTDRLIIKTALSDKFIVCTLDRNLRIILKKLHIPVIFYSNKKLHIIW
ncbi:MAG: PIN domain-containing protein [Candidatus Nanopusillus sp.]|jgi:rRNA-processing protein FCF1